jgi:outer membrane protein assembly factor BamD (BamD/ComL family)
MKLSYKYLFVILTGFAVFSAAGLLGGCATGPVNISQDLSAAELIQRAQEASDRNHYSLALRYYEAVLERNAFNIELVCTAEYEIAFIHYKQKKYETAKSEFRALLTRYDSSDEELLPAQFKKLALIVMNRIAEKEAPKPPFSWFQKKKT